MLLGLLGVGDGRDGRDFYYKDGLEGGLVPQSKMKRGSNQGSKR